MTKLIPNRVLVLKKQNSEVYDQLNTRRIVNIFMVSEKIENLRKEALSEEDFDTAISTARGYIDKLQSQELSALHRQRFVVRSSYPSCATECLDVLNEALQKKNEIDATPVAGVASFIL